MRELIPKNYETVIVEMLNHIPNQATNKKFTTKNF